MAQIQHLNCNINTFVTILHRLLRKHEACFHYGSFVFQDNDQKLFNLLLKGSKYPSKNTSNCDNISYRVSPISKFLTHTIFMFNQKFSKRVANNKNCEIDVKFRDNVSKKLKVWFSYEKDVYGDDLCGICKITKKGCQSPKKIILFYPFRIITKEGEKYTFLFLKLETESMLSIKHIKGAIHSYVLKNSDRDPEKANDILNKRREHSKTYDFDKQDTELYEELLLMKDEQSKQSIEFYNDCVRGGNELFIPYIITEAIIDSLEK